ncbi:3182_t:CDS:2, partial [Dentiscutata heterogama]
KHKKVIGLLENEVFLNGCQEWLQQQSPESRSPRALKMHIEEAILPKIENAKNTISEKMCRIYMHALGYKYDERKKGVYYDGHERPDVVAYRKGWLERMFRYKMYMKDFVGDMLEIVIEPELESDERELTRKDEDVLRPKHMGRSIMVSAFMCQCHGVTTPPDFCEQQSILEEALIKAGHIFERYPKFYCECNFIERYWGFLKRELRASCSYNYNDLLRRIPEVLNSVPTSTIRKYVTPTTHHLAASILDQVPVAS